MQQVILAIFLLYLPISEISGQFSSAFTYATESTWPTNFTHCGGWRQSPINIEMSTTQPLTAKSYFSTAYYTIKPLTMSVENTGNTILITGTWPAGQRPYIYGGPLTDKYIFAEIRFHWAASSEHLFGNRSSNIEMQIFHYKKSYGSLLQAMNYPDGIAIFTTLYGLDPKLKIGNGLTSLIYILQGLTTPGQARNVLPFPLSMFDLDVSGMGYVSYTGSLTIPPCTQNVIWIIGVEIKPVMQLHINPFLKLKLSNSDTKNSRPVKPLNRRVVYYYKDRSV